MRIKPISKKLPTATGAVQLIQAVVFVSLSVIGTRALSSNAEQVLELNAPQSVTSSNEGKKFIDSQIWVIGKGEQYLIDNSGQLYFVGTDGQKLPID